MISNIGVVGRRNRGQGGTPPPTDERWVGFPNTNGVPNSPVGAWTSYENTGDRCYGRSWVATEAGIVKAVNVRWGENVGVGPYLAWLFCYKNSIKAGSVQIDPTGSASTWSGDIILTAHTEGLDFDIGDELIFGMGFDADGACGLSQDVSAGSPGNRFVSTTLLSSGPVSPLTFGTSGTNLGLAVIGKYEV